jgi:large subunit ribosomal protein L29
MRASELRDLTDQELLAKEQETAEALFRLRLRRGTNQLDSPAALRKTRRDLARLKTVRAERVRATAAEEKS